jgi:acyl-CoA synthetase (AMP-forming)/AMP-acid ligase II
MILDLLENGSSSAAALTVAGGPSINYGDLKMQVERLAASLGQFGLGRGDRIAMALPNGIELVTSFLAAATTGTAAPLNPSYKCEEFKFYLEDTRARALIVPPVKWKTPGRQRETAF